MSRTINYKAKYEKALERARVYWETDNDNTLDIKARGTMEHLFPELVNSNESVRRKIIALVNAHGQSMYKNAMINWLEKLKVFTERGDGLYYFGNNGFTYLGTHTWDNVSCIEKQGKQKSSDDLTQQEAMDIAVAKCFEQGGQNPTDKVEQKFKVGDWITWEEINTGLIVKVDDDKYEVEFIDGNKTFPHIEYVDRKFHLWTIKDAKKGDILANDKVICIYQERVSEHVIKVSINYSRKEDIETHYEVIGDFNLYPATKEERDFFFSKLK